MGKKTKRDSVTSGGQRRTSRIVKAVRRLGYKIARWERYQAEGKACSGKVPGRGVSKKRSPSTKSRHKKWDTTGLKKHKELLASFL